MLDYNWNGIPIAKMPTGEIVGCLKNGFFIRDTEGDPRSIPELLTAVRKRLELELLIRREGLR